MPKVIAWADAVLPQPLETSLLLWRGSLQLEGRLEAFLAEEKGASQGQVCRGPTRGTLRKQSGPSQSEGHVTGPGGLCTRMASRERSRPCLYHQHSCFPHSPVRLISYMTGNACGLELSGDLHINLGMAFPDLPSPPKGKKIHLPITSQELQQISPLLDPFPGVTFISNCQRKGLKLREIQWLWNNQDFGSGFSNWMLVSFAVCFSPLLIRVFSLSISMRVYQLNSCVWERLRMGKAGTLFLLERRSLEALFWGSPGDLVVKNLPCNAGYMGSIPGLRGLRMPRSS